MAPGSCWAPTVTPFLPQSYFLGLWLLKQKTILYLPIFLSSFLANPSSTTENLTTWCWRPIPLSNSARFCLKQKGERRG